MSNDKQMVALVTGASSGLGTEFAKFLASDGHSLVLVGRNQERLAKLAEGLKQDFHVSVWQYTLDLSQPAGVAELWQMLTKDHLEVEILINNAGVGLVGEFAKLDPQKQLALLHLNVTAVTDLAQRVLPGMLERNQGKILNVASIAAYQPGPLMAVYYASKAYVLSLSEALWEETRGMGVTVTALCPGPTETGFAAGASLTQTALFRQSRADAKSVARRGYAGLLAGKRVVLPDSRSAVSSWIVKIVPHALLLRLIRRLHQD